MSKFQRVAEIERQTQANLEPKLEALRQLVR